MLHSMMSFYRGKISVFGKRSRFFIHLHHIAILAFVAWIGYLFALRELM